MAIANSIMYRPAAEVEKSRSAIIFKTFMQQKILDNDQAMAKLGRCILSLQPGVIDHQTKGGEK
jgi:hypothetical protein